MNITFNLSEYDFGQTRKVLQHALNAHMSQVLYAMQQRLYEAILANFGPSGFDRPWPWKPLSKEYAKKVARRYATLQVSGALKGSLRKSYLRNDGTASVYFDGSVAYAAAHHYGSKRMPARRVMPITKRDEITPKTFLAVQEAARKALRDAMKGGD